MGEPNPGNLPPFPLFTLEIKHNGPYFTFVHMVQKHRIASRLHLASSIVTKVIQIFHSCSSTAEAFNRSTGQKADEDLASIRNRQNIQRLVLSGKIGEAVALTEKLYPGLLETNPTLQFTLKVLTCQAISSVLIGAWPNPRVW